MFDIDGVYKMLKRINVCIQYGDYDAAREYANIEMENILKLREEGIEGME